MSLTVYLALVFNVFIAVAIMVMVCGRHGLGAVYNHYLRQKVLRSVVLVG